MKELEDLLASPGWEIIQLKLLDRRDAFARELLYASTFEKMTFLQAQIREIDFLLKYPHDVIQAEKHKEAS